MDKCPYCGAETRQGDNFCLSCGHRLIAMPAAMPPQEVRPVSNDATLPAPEEWANYLQGTPGAGSGLATAPGWLDEGGETLAAADPEAPTYRAESPAPAPTAQATLDRIEQPARFILRSDSGEIVQEYTLDKRETTIGRAPNSDILLSKDKLTSRKHATIHYENGQYMIRDERSANGTFVNGQQIEEMTFRLLHDDDHVGIGEHELVFKAYASPSEQVAQLPTILVGPGYTSEEVTARTREDPLATVASDDGFSTRAMDDGAPAPAQPAATAAPVAQEALATPSPVPTPPAPPQTEPTVQASAQAFSMPPVPSTPPATVAPSPATEPPVVHSSGNRNEANVTFNRLTSLPQPNLPEMGGLIAALSTLDGQVTTLQEQLNKTMEAMRNHELEISKTTTELRTSVRRVSDRMDNAIADVARSRETLAWSELLSLIEDVMNNPRDIEYASKLTRKARELNKIFQIHQNVLNTMAECNSLLRGIVGEEK